MAVLPKPWRTYGGTRLCGAACWAKSSAKIYDSVNRLEPMRSGVSGCVCAAAAGADAPSNSAITGATSIAISTVDNPVRVMA